MFSSKLHIYTDGGHKSKWGSWAFVVVQNNKIIFENSGRVAHTTSHHMEFQAAIEALKYLNQSLRTRLSKLIRRFWPQQVILHSDSRTLIKSMAHPKSKRPQINADQLAELDVLALQHNISWVWIKAHSGNPYNERCDELCIRVREN